MSFLGKLFGKKPAASTPPTPPPVPPEPVPPGAPATFKVWDNYGRLMEIPREEWRTKVLPHNFQKAWNNADELSGFVINALNDGFIADALEPARQLHRIDPDQKRSATLLAVIYLQLKRPKEAADLITETLRRLGDDGVLMTNLAKAQGAMGDTAQSERTLWRALEIEPNQDNGFGWFVAIHRERSSEAAAAEAMRRVAALPGSWRAQLWLGHDALKADQLESALAFFQEALSRAGKPAPADLLGQISGDLGNAGHIPEILRLVAPHFDAAAHGLDVGNNLVKAHFDLGQLDAARAVLDRLYALKRPDWNEALSYWDTEIAKARVAIATPTTEEQLRVALLPFEGPVWLKPSSPAAELFPAKLAGSPVIGFTGSTAEIASNSKRVERQLSNNHGRLSRALPAFLAEQVEFGSDARTCTIVPWIVGDEPGFVVGTEPWSDEDAAAHARQLQVPADYIAVCHLRTTVDPWTAEVTVVRTIDARRLGTLTAKFPADNPGRGIPELGGKLLALLAEHAAVSPATPSPAYAVPPADAFGNYLLRLEQLMAVRCSGMDGMRAGFLSGEREILGGNLQQCLTFPGNIGLRILFAQTLLAMKRSRPEVVPEFRAQVALLQKEHPLPEPAHGVIQRLMQEAFPE